MAHAKFEPQAPIDLRTKEERAADAARQAKVEEKLHEDMTELRAIERAEKGVTLTLVEELREIANSTALDALRMRRVWECFGRRSGEVTLALLERGDVVAMWANAWCRGLRWHSEAQAWLPAEGVEPGRRTVRLRRLGPDRAKPFVYKTGLRELSLEDQKALAKAWSAAPADKRGPDPCGVWVRVTPDANGEFELPFSEGVKCWRALKDTTPRARRRRNGEADSLPIVEECGPAAAYVPVVVLDAPGGAA